MSIMLLALALGGETVPTVTRVYDTVGADGTKLVCVELDRPRSWASTTTECRPRRRNPAAAQGWSERTPAGSFTTDGQFRSPTNPTGTH